MAGEDSAEKVIPPESSLENARLGTQFRVAYRLVQLIGHDRLTHDEFQKIAKPLRSAIIIDSNRAITEKEQQRVEHTEKLLGMMAWIAVDGDRQKAIKIMGSAGDEIGADVTSQDFENKVRSMIERLKTSA